MGFEPVEAETVSAALAAFEAETPAAVLLDINLPDGSGLDVLRKIRQRQQDAVVIMITANVLVDETIAALRGGAYDFIGKPINLEELQVAIRNGIEAGRLRKEVNLYRAERAQQFSLIKSSANHRRCARCWRSRTRLPRAKFRQSCCKANQVPEKTWSPKRSITIPRAQRIHSSQLTVQPCRAR